LDKTVEIAWGLYTYQILRISLGLQLEQESFSQTFSTLGQKSLARHAKGDGVHISI